MVKITIHKIIKSKVSGKSRYKCNPFIKVVKGNYSDKNARVNCGNCKR